MEDQNLSQPKPDVQEGLENLGQENKDITPQSQIDWESAENPYKKQYGDSQSQIQPLIRTLQLFAEYDHQTKTWKPKIQTSSNPQIQDANFEKMLESYDPDFKRVLVGYTQSQIKAAFSEFKKESILQDEYNTALLDSRGRAMGEFGDEFEFVKNGKMNEQSPLYALANEIVVRKYFIPNSDGKSGTYSTPEAEYLATVEAYAILSKHSKQQQPKKEQLSAIQGKGTKAAVVKRQLSPEEYSNLNDAEKDAYDEAEGGV